MVLIMIIPHLSQTPIILYKSVHLFLCVFYPNSTQGEILTFVQLQRATEYQQSTYLSEGAFRCIQLVNELNP